MALLVVTHPACLRHDPGRGHPERPARLEAVLRGLRGAGVPIEEVEAPAAERGLLEEIHPPAYVEAIRRFCAAGGGPLDADTAAGPESWEAALRAAGAGWAAVERLREGSWSGAFAAVRPPGHHALPNRAMGFCLFNNVALVAARLASEDERVAVVDWDVHHGNGTQQIFYEDPRVLYVSLHQRPLYPGTGGLEELGRGEGRGTTLNLPFPPGTAGQAYRAAFDRVVVPLLGRFRPSWLLVSAGYDAHRADPLAHLELAARDYRYMAAALAGVAPGRMVLFLEGGYDLEALERSAAATAAGVVWGQEQEEAVPMLRGPALQVLEQAERLVAEHWEPG